MDRNTVHNYVVRRGLKSGQYHIGHYMLYNNRGEVDAFGEDWRLVDAAPLGKVTFTEEQAEAVAAKLNELGQQASLQYML